jgi:hypothetical protein
VRIEESGEWRVERWWGGRGDDDANMNEKNNDLNSEEEYW